MKKNDKGILINNQWNEEDWKIFQEKLSMLTSEELFSLATVTGLIFEEPLSNLKKDDFLCALDEVDREELETTYDILIKSKNKK